MFGMYRTSPGSNTISIPFNNAVDAADGSAAVKVFVVKVITCGDCDVVLE